MLMYSICFGPLFVVCWNVLWLDVFQIDQFSSVSVHLGLNLIEHAVAAYVSSALPNTISIQFICMQITTLAIHHLCLLGDLHTELQFCINDAFTPQMHSWWKHMHTIQYWQTIRATNELKLIWTEQFETALIRFFLKNWTQFSKNFDHFIQEDHFKMKCFICFLRIE